MESIIETFHVDIKLLLAQIVNFAIVFSVLYFFALKPITKVMQDRGKRIEKSLEDAKVIEQRLTKTEEDYNKKLGEGRKKGEVILEKAKEQAEEKKSQLIARAKEEIGQIIDKEKAIIRSEKAKTIKEIKSEIAGLVEITLEKVLEEKIDDAKDKELIKKAIK